MIWKATNIAVPRTIKSPKFNSNVSKFKVKKLNPIVAKLKAKMICELILFPLNIKKTGTRITLRPVMKAAFDGVVFVNPTV